MSESVYLLTLFSVLGTVLLVFALRYITLARQTRSRSASAEAYRELASQSTRALTDASERLGIVQSELALLGTRFAAIEQILKEVE